MATKKKQKGLSKRSRRLIVLSLVLALLVAGFWGGRNAMLSSALGKAKNLCAEKLQADLTWSKPHWTGLAAFRIDEIKLEREGRTLFKSERLEVKVNLMGYLRGGQRLRFLGADRTDLVWPPREKKTPATPEKMRRLPKLPDALADLPGLLKWCPEQIELSSTMVELAGGDSLLMEVIQLYEAQVFMGGGEFHLGTYTDLRVRGRFDPLTGAGYLTLSRDIIRSSANFLHWEAEPIAYHGDSWEYKNKVYGSGLYPFDESLPGTEKRLTDQLESDFVIFGSKGNPEWKCSGGEIRYGQARFNPAGSAYDFEKGTLQLRLRGEGNYQDLIRSLPGKPVVLTEEVVAEGSWTTTCNLEVPGGELSATEVHIEYEVKGVKTTSPLPALDKFRKPFDYTPEGSTRTLRMSPDAPGYTRMADISPVLKASVILAEDPHFYSHHGIDTAVFRKAILDNLSDGKFSRGGSTITMQLVKNILLTRQKSIPRKAEEVLLTLIIESDTSITKDHLLELYLNLIEWGPGVYGVKEAAAFYFSKTPAQLTVDESLFLACIIPNPKKYSALLDAEGGPGAEAETIFDLLKMQLYDADAITEEQWDAPVNLHLSPRALQAIQ